MTDRPIIFSAPMIRALLAEAKEPGTGKSMTRRLLYSQRDAKAGIIPGSATFLHPYPQPRLDTSRHPIGTYWTLSPWYRARAGDRLWVKETWQKHHSYATLEDAARAGPLMGALYRATHGPNNLPLKWRPSIYMPRVHSRLTLVVTATKIERLQEISEQDCEREGLVWCPMNKIWGVKVEGGYSPYGLTAQECFMNLFCDLHGPHVWADNPWVVALTFAVRHQNIDAMKEAA